MALDTPSLEAVYYSGPIPSSPAVLTYMGLVFDKIHFPNVYLPSSGYDIEEVRKEADRILGLGVKNYNSALLVGVLRFLPYVSELKDFCYFSGHEGQIFGDVDKSANEIVKVLDEEIFGPPSNGFIPIHETGHHKALPGGEQYIDYPGSLYYPANAIVYASKHGIPLINADPNLPVPALGGDHAKDNEKLLSTILAMECANLVMPKIRPLPPQEIMEMREYLHEHLHQFRIALLKLTAELNKVIESGCSNDEVLRAAKFLVNTEVKASLLELKDQIEAPSTRWYKRAFDVVKQAPVLCTAYSTMPPHLFFAQLLATLGGVLVDMQAEGVAKKASRTGMYYLLKLHDLNDE